MTMQAMVDYLEAKGFKVDKTYNYQTREYEFGIEKNGRFMVSYFKYPEYDPPAGRHEKQREFLKSLVTAFANEYENCGSYIEQLEERIKIYVDPRGFMVMVNKADPYFHVILHKCGYQRSLQIHPGDPSVNTFEKLKGRFDRLMDEIDYIIEYDRYCKHDVEVTREMWSKINPFIVGEHCGIKNVIFNDPATIVLWTDGTKTVVKAKNEAFDPEKGLAMAISKKALGNKGNYYNVFTKWLPEEEEVKPSLKLNYIPNTERLSKGMNKVVKAWDDFCSKLGDELNHD